MPYKMLKNLKYSLLTIFFFLPLTSSAFEIGVDYASVYYPSCIIEHVESGRFYYDGTSFSGFETFRNESYSTNILYYYPAFDGWYIGEEGIGNYFELSAIPETDPNGTYYVGSGSAGESYCTAGVDYAVVVYPAGGTTTPATSTNPLAVSDKTASFGLAIIVVLLFVITLGFMFNSLNKKK